MTISLLSIRASIVLVSVGGLNLGVDFVGGQMVRVTFSDTPDLDDLRKRVAALGFGDVTIQQLGGPHDVTIRTPLPEGSEGASNRASTALQHTVLAGYPDARFGSVQAVYGTVSVDLFRTVSNLMLFGMYSIS